MSRGGKRQNAGRKAGTQGKTTREIREILDKVCDWEKLAKKFYDLAIQGSVAHGKILMEYRFAYPKESTDLEEKRFNFVIGGNKPPEREFEKIEIVTVHKTLEQVLKARAEQKEREQLEKQN